MADWRQIEDDREKYAAYLCSREWAILKEAVHERAKGLCEACHVFAIDAVHHLTYERKYHENVEDLQGNCKHCHNFTHGKSEFNPCGADLARARYLGECVRNNLQPLPTQLIGSGCKSVNKWTSTMLAIEQLLAICEHTKPGEADAVSEAINVLESHLPFSFWPAVGYGFHFWSSERYEIALKACGFDVGFWRDDFEHPSGVVA